MAGQTPPEQLQQAAPPPPNQPTAENTIVMPSPDELRRRDEVKGRQVEFINSVPEEYRTKEYIQNFAKTDDPKKEMFKSFDSAHSMVGARAEIKPLDANATDDQKKEYYKKLGVPDDVKEYKAGEATWSDEDKEVGQFVAANSSPKLVERMANVSQKLGLTPAQFKGLTEEWSKAIVSEHKDQLKTQLSNQAQSKTRDEDFAKEADKAFGNRKDVVLSNGKQMLEDAVNPAFKESLKTLDNKTLIILASALDGIHAKYIREGSFSSNSGMAAPPPKTKEQLSAERRALYADPGFKTKDPLILQKINENDAEERRLRGMPSKVY